MTRLEEAALEYRQAKALFDAAYDHHAGCERALGEAEAKLRLASKAESVAYANLRTVALETP